ncbi:MAG: hypothetical protein K2Y27_22305 [Xanthobacteraceae bacterium]|nr:hypothetical protein [Xanthobacteraceae bacterium]
MRHALFLLLRLICYPALAAMLAAGVALGVVWVNGQCPPFDEIGVTCATKFSQALADFGLSIALISATTGIPGIPALGGAWPMVLDLRRWRKSRSVAA